MCAGRHSAPYCGRIPKQQHCWGLKLGHQGWTARHGCGLVQQMRQQHAQVQASGGTEGHKPKATSECHTSSGWGSDFCAAGGS